MTYSRADSTRASTDASSSAAGTTRLRKPGAVGLSCAEGPTGHYQLLGQRRANLADKTRVPPPQARGIPRSTSGIEKKVMSAATTQITRRGEDKPSTVTVAMQSRHRDGPHRLDGLSHEAPGVGGVARERWQTAPNRPLSQENAARSAPAQNARPRPSTTTTFTSCLASKESGSVYQFG